MVARRLPASHPGEGLKLRPEYPTLSSRPYAEATSSEMSPLQEQ